MKLLNILITSAGGNGAGNQIAKSLRLIKNGRYNLFYADNNPNNIQFRDESILELPLVSDENYDEKIVSFVEANKINVIVPGSDKELYHFATRKEFYEKKQIFIPINNINTIGLCLDKSLLNEKLIELNYLPPKSIKFTFNKELPDIDWYPVVLKPSDGGGGSANVFIAQDKIELHNLLMYLNQAYKNESFFLQEYVGTFDSEYTVGILHDHDGSFVDSIAMKRDLTQSISVRSSVKNNTKKFDLGKQLVISSGVSQGVIGKFEDITLQCRDIAESIGSTGPLNIQCRFERGKVRVFEINPRFSGTSFFRSLVGFNEVDLLLRKHLLNEDINRDTSWDDFIAIRSLEETIFKK
jgi:carbamoyl-phosphate synthase large subunit